MPRPTTTEDSAMGKSLVCKSCVHTLKEKSSWASAMLCSLGDVRKQV